MKTATLLLLLLLSGCLALASNQNSSFMIVTKANDAAATRGETVLTGDFL